MGAPPQRSPRTNRTLETSESRSTREQLGPDSAITPGASRVIALVGLPLPREGRREFAPDLFTGARNGRDPGRRLPALERDALAARAAPDGKRDAAIDVAEPRDLSPARRLCHEGEDGSL